MKPKPSRRKFLGLASTLVTGSLLTAGRVTAMPAIVNIIGKSNAAFNGVKFGLITYSFRDLPDQSAEATLDYVTKCGVSAIELMGGPAEMYAGAPKSPYEFRDLLPVWTRQYRKEELSEDDKKMLAKMEVYRGEMAQWRAGASTTKFEELGKMYKKAGIEIYAFKPDAFSMRNTDAEIEYGLKAAKAMGASHVTLEHPANDAHTLKLGKAAEKYGLKVGYHGHEQQTPTFWDTALTQSPANALNLDFGHYVAAGNANPLDIIRQKGDRIVSMHVKDRKTKANGGENMPFGTGDTPIADALRLMRDKKYTFPATIELEYKIPEGSSPVEEVKKCLEYCKRAIA